MAEIDLMDSYPKITRPIDERARASVEDRILAKRFGKEYFDGTRQQGCGGYYYDGRWRPIAERFRDYYGLTGKCSVLDVGCAKGFLLHDLLEAVPGIQVAGVDISDYVLSHAIESIKPFLCLADAKELPFPDKSFDLVVSIATVHNLELDEVRLALRELERVSRRHKFIKVGAYRSEEERVALEKWNIVAKTFMFCHEWERLFAEVGYTGDYYWFTP
jgi:SAM-dependent methyltransferase